MLRDGQAIIEPRGDTYVAKSNMGDVIAVSDNLDIVIKRIKHAQPDVEAFVKLNDKTLSIDEYKNTLKPVIYRLIYGESGKTGFIGALDYKKNGKYSEVKLFDSVDEIEEYIRSKQIDEDYYYVFARRRRGLNLNAGGLDHFDLDKETMDTSRLSEALKSERVRRNSKIVAAKEIELKDGKFDVLQLYEI